VTPLQQHCQDWKSGCGSDQCPTGKDGCRPNTRIVFGRGSIPCDVLFIGQAPGWGENTTGKAFIGEAGELLDKIIEGAFKEWCHDARVHRQYYSLTWSFANLVNCIPLDEDMRETEPDGDQILACTPRLEEFIRVASPKLIVCVGKLAEKWLEPGYKHSVRIPAGVQMAHIVHPAAILKGMPLAQKSQAIQRCIVVVREATRKVMGTKS